MIALICLALAIVAYVISQLQQHGKLRFSKSNDGFWNVDSFTRKYKWNKLRKDPFGYGIIPLPDEAPDNWYYRFFKIKYKERFPLSATFLVLLTDGYHFMQFWMFNFLALSLTFAHGWNWYLFGGLIIGIRLVHWVARKLFSK